MPSVRTQAHDKSRRREAREARARQRMARFETEDVAAVTIQRALRRRWQQRQTGKALAALIDVQVACGADVHTRAGRHSSALAAPAHAGRPSVPPTLSTPTPCNVIGASTGRPPAGLAFTSQEAGPQLFNILEVACDINESLDHLMATLRTQ